MAKRQDGKLGHCSQCGAVVAPNARFCHICGNELSTGVPAGAPQRKQGFPWMLGAVVAVLLVAYSLGRSSTSPTRTQQVAMTARTTTARVPTSTPDATSRAKTAAQQTQEAQQARIDEGTATAAAIAEATVARQTEIADATRTAMQFSTATAEARATALANATTEQTTQVAEKTQVAREATVAAEMATSVSLTATAMPTPTETATPRPTATPAPTATPLPTPTPTPVPIGTTVETPAPLGTTLTADGLAVTVESAYFDYGFANAIPRGGYKVLIIQVTIRNDGDGNEHYDAANFSGIDANTNANYDPVTLDDVGVLLRDGNLEPGEFVSGTVLIEVQETAANVIIKYDPAMFTTEDLYWS